MTNLAECDKQIYEKGTVVFMTHSLSSEDTEAWVKKIAEQSQQPVDWHYFAGRILIKALGDLDRVTDAMRALMPEHDEAYCLGDSQRTGPFPQPDWW